MTKQIVGKIALALFLILGGIMPLQAEAETVAAWTRELPGFESAVDRVALENSGDAGTKVGLVARETTADHNLVFFLRENGTWQNRSYNFEGADMALNFDLQYLSGSTWVLAVSNTVNSTNIYKTTNDGINWTALTNITQCGGACFSTTLSDRAFHQPSITYPGTGTNLLMILGTGNTTILDRIAVYRSSNSGENWTFIRYLDSTGTEYSACVGMNTTGNGYAQWLSTTGSDGHYHSTTDDSGLFWSPPVLDETWTISPPNGCRIDSYAGTQVLAFQQASGGSRVQFMAYNGIPPTPGTYATFTGASDGGSEPGRPPAIAIGANQIQLGVHGNGTTEFYIRCGSTTWTKSYSQTMNPGGIISAEITSDNLGVVAWSNTTSSGRLEVFVKTISCPAPVVGTVANAYASLIGARAFDIDPDGTSVLIVQRDNGTNISTHAPGSLAQIGIENVGCTLAGADATATPGGADATAYNFNGYVAYTACGTIGGGGGSDVDEIRIRSPTLGTPVGLCSYCESNVSDILFTTELPDNFHELHYVEQYPYTFAGAGSSSTVIAFPFTEVATGRWGIYAVQMKSSGFDENAVEYVSFGGAGATIDGLCSWRSTATGSDYIAVASSSVGMAVYTFTINANVEPPVITISPSHGTPGSFTNPRHLSCAGNMIMVGMTGSRAGAFYFDADGTHTAGEIAWGPTTLSTYPGAIYHNQVYLSPSAAFGSVLDATGIHVVNATTGVYIQNISQSADFYGARIDRTNNNIWTLTGYPVGNLSRYSIACATNNCTEVVSTNPSPTGTGTNSTSAITSTTTTTPSLSPAQDPTKPLGQMIQYLSDAWGFEWAWIIGLIILLMVLIPIMMLTKGNPIVAGVIIIGVDVSNVKMGLWEEWSIFAMIFLIIAIAGNRMFHSGESDAS